MIWAQIICYRDCEFQLWDTASDFRFQCLSQLSYRDADVFVIVYDATKYTKNYCFNHEFCDINLNLFYIRIWKNVFTL